MHTCSDFIDRRRFLYKTGALSLGLTLPWACVPDRSDEPDATTRNEGAADAGVTGEGEAAPSPEEEGLPPRVIGLRTSGGAFRFDPAGLLIEPGTEVHWLNMGDFHTVSAFHPDNANLLGGSVPLRIPEGAASFHSGTLGLTAGTQFTHRFDLEGVYDYFCQPHYAFGMVGRIVVGGPHGGPALTGDPTDLIEAARERLPSVELITGPAGVLNEWASRLNGTLYAAANGRDATTPGALVVEGMRADDALRAHVDEAWDDVDRALDVFSTALEEGADYERLLQNADQVKAGLGSS